MEIFVNSNYWLLSDSIIKQENNRFNLDPVESISGYPTWSMYTHSETGLLYEELCDAFHTLSHSSSYPRELDDSEFEEFTWRGFRVSTADLGWGHNNSILKGFYLYDEVIPGKNGCVALVTSMNVYYMNSYKDRLGVDNDRNFYKEEAFPIYSYFGENYGKDCLYLLWILLKGDASLVRVSEFFPPSCDSSWARMSFYKPTKYPEAYYDDNSFIVWFDENTALAGERIDKKKKSIYCKKSIDSGYIYFLNLFYKKDGIWVRADSSEFNNWIAENSESISNTLKNIDFTNPVPGSDCPIHEFIECDPRNFNNLLLKWKKI